MLTLRSLLYHMLAGLSAAICCTCFEFAYVMNNSAGDVLSKNQCYIVHGRNIMRIYNCPSYHLCKTALNPEELVLCP